jgi:glyoxylase-like metal-dependent hydrolase (beta-lactamase superfamily II)
MHISPLALKSCICAAVFMLFAALEASAAMPAGDPFELEWRELAPGVWAGVRPMSWRQPVVGSTVVVIGKTGVLVYDPAGFALQGERLVRKVAELTELPITHLAVSHWHDDHHLGVYKVLEKFPKAELIAQEFTARAVASPLMGDIDGPSDEELKAQRESMRKALETGTRSDGTPVTESAREYYADVLRYGESVVADMRRAKVSVPTATVKDRRIVDLGGRQVELRHIAPGNTKGDLFLWLPEERILATGDIVVRPTPYGFGSYPRTWAGVLRDLKALDPRVIVPGHGDILTDTAYLDLLAETMDLVVKQVDPRVAEGKGLEEIRAAFDWSPVQERFTGGDAMRARLFELWFKTPIVEAEYNEATGKGNESLDLPEG